MKTLFNKFMMAMVAVMMVIGFSAFKMTENSYDDSVWYVVFLNGNNELEIDSEFFGTPIYGTHPNACATDNPGQICAVELIMGAGASNPTGKELDEVLLDPQISLGNTIKSPEDQ